MKFICENCKAKYQIGDDKVAGRSVRMKCRRCGHLIQLAAVGEAAAAGEGPASSEMDDPLLETGPGPAVQARAAQGASRQDDSIDEDPTRAMSVEQRAGNEAAAALAQIRASAAARPGAAAGP